MQKTYKAVQVSQFGKLEMVERNIPTPQVGEVLIAVEACGICGADATTVESSNPDFQYPRVPGHEVVGRIIAIADSSSYWKIGQRVGVSRLGGHCNHCAECRQGLF